MEGVVEVLRRLGGQARTAELVSATSKKALAAAVGRGDISRLARGTHGSPESPASQGTTGRAALVRDHG